MRHLLGWQCHCTQGPFLSADACGQRQGWDPGPRFGVLPPSLAGALRVGNCSRARPLATSFPSSRVLVPAPLGSWFLCTKVTPARSPRRMTWGVPTCQPPLSGSMCLCSVGIPHMCQAGEQRGTDSDLGLRSTPNPKGSGPYTSEAGGFPGKEMQQKRKLQVLLPGLRSWATHGSRPPVLPTCDSSHLFTSPRETKFVPPVALNTHGGGHSSSFLQSALPAAPQSRPPRGPPSSLVSPPKH